MRHFRYIGGIALGLLLVAGGYAVFSRQSAQTQDDTSDVLFLAQLTATSSSSVNISEAIAHPADPPDGYIVYRNERYGFLFYHSPQSIVTEFDEGQGAMTITLENFEKVRGLQIFIVPYAESVITEERFLLDVPSGVRKNVAETFLGLLQVPAVTFNGYDQFLGETREVWFLYRGYLFEVTTFKGLSDWFAPIMQTWRFVE